VSVVVEKLKPKFLFNGHCSNPPKPYKIRVKNVYPMSMDTEIALKENILSIGEAL
jgi:hypothetical protein